MAGRDLRLTMLCLRRPPMAGLLALLGNASGAVAVRRHLRSTGPTHRVRDWAFVAGPWPLARRSHRLSLPAVQLGGTGARWWVWPVSSATAPTPAGAWPPGSSTFVGEGLLVLGLPRGGVVVAEQVAKELGAPLDVLCASSASSATRSLRSVRSPVAGPSWSTTTSSPSPGSTTPNWKRRAAARLTVVEEMEQALRGDRPPRFRRSRGGAGGRRVGHWGHDARPP